MLTERPALSVLDILRRIDAGALTAGTALRASEEAIETEDAALHAFVHRPSALRAEGSGPLAGIAVGVKDVFDTADLPTEYGSAIYAGWQPKADAPIVSALRAAGATVAGKTATTAFAYLDPAATVNPHDHEHTPGGSSSGSAAAVAAGLVPLALGTQTGGSVIRPAAFCGVVGVKPSYRILPTVGLKAFSWSLDTPGLFAATVADAAFALAGLTGRQDLRVDGTEPQAPRIGLVRQDFAGEPEAEADEALSRAVRACERAGARVKPVALPSLLAEAFGNHATLQDFEARQALAWEYDAHPAALPPKLKGALDAAQTIPVEAYDDARRTAHRARGALDSVWNDVDVLLTFSAPGPAPRGLGSTGDARYNRLWTLMGTPCVNVPAGFSGGGLPLGVQVIAPFGRDRAGLLAALYLEAALAKSP